MALELYAPLTYNMSYYKAIGFSALLTALRKCQRGVMWKDSTAGYSLNGLKNCYLRRQELLNDTYKISRYQRFTIKEPKRRDILAAYINDRHVQRALCDYSAYPALAKSFIRDNYACQSGKGVADAQDRLKVFMRRYYNKHKSVGYVLQCDVKGYFPNTWHKVAQEKLLESDADKQTIARMCEVIESFCEANITDELRTLGQPHDTALKTAHFIATQRASIVRAKILGTGADRIKDTENKMHKRLNSVGITNSDYIRHLMHDDFKGIGLGSQLSQLTQLLILDKLDHIIKEDLHIKYYVRYMDDFILIHPDKEHLKHCKNVIQGYLDSVNLQLNDKSKLYQLKQGIIFLKWRFRYSETGKVVMTMIHSKVTKQRRKMRALADMIKRGERTITDAEASFKAFQSHAERGDTFKQIYQLRKYYKELYRRQAPHGSKFFKK